MSEHEERLSDEHRRQMAAEHLRQLRETMAALGFQVSVPDEGELGRLQLRETNVVFVAIEREQQPTDWPTLRDQMGLNAGRRPNHPLFARMTVQRYSMENRPEGWSMGGKVPFHQVDPADLERLLADLMPVGMMPSGKLAHYILMRRPEVLLLLLMSTIFAAAEQARRDSI